MCQASQCWFRSAATSFDSRQGHCNLVRFDRVPAAAHHIHKNADKTAEDDVTRDPSGDMALDSGLILLTLFLCQDHGMVSLVLDGVLTVYVFNLKSIAIECEGRGLT